MSDDDSLLGKLVLTGLVLALSPFVEVLTGAAPIGSAGALAALAVIWGLPALNPDGGEA